MQHQFKKHYTPDEARALLPRINAWLTGLDDLRSKLDDLDAQLTKALGLGDDLGGPLVNSWVHTLSDIKTILVEFQIREIQIKDLDKGLIDFPSLVGDKEVFLCWEKGEVDIEFWHDLTSGYSGRERLE